jgi:hypothetical protein
MLELMSGLLGAPNERIWPGMRGLPHAEKYRLPPQPFNYLRKVGRGGLGGGELGGHCGRLDRLWLHLLHPPQRHFNWGSPAATSPLSLTNPATVLPPTATPCCAGVPAAQRRWAGPAQPPADV